MKTPDSAPKTTGPGLSQTLKTLGLLFLLGNLASCSTSAKSSQATFEPNHWHKVSDSPPTYFPKGIPANHPTGPNDGKWVLTEDGAKTSYFVPSSGVATKILIAEAMTQSTSGREEGNGTNLKTGLGGAISSGLLGFGNALLGLDEHINRTTGNPTKGGAIANERNHQAP